MMRVRVTGDYEGPLVLTFWTMGVEEWAVKGRIVMVW